jgi:transposase
MKVSKKERQMQICHPNAAGIDIGATKHYVAVPPGITEEHVRSFGCFTQDLYELLHWLRECKVDTVAMESTSIYWIPLFKILEANGIEVYLVNAYKSKSVPGRKTDVQDCQWLQQLHTYGLLQASFQLDKNIKQLRTIIRHRDTQIRQSAAEVQRMQKCLTQMNIQLHNVISNITGESGMKILKAILSGERNPQNLAALCNARIKASSEVVVKSLEGTWDEDHLFVLKQCVCTHEFYQNIITECDREIEDLLNKIQREQGTEQVPPSSKRSERRKTTNIPQFDMRSYLYKITGVDLTRIDGLSSYSCMVILSEIGTDMSRWPTAKHFTSWLGLCPRNKISGDRVISSRTSRTKNKASIMFRTVVQTLSHSKSAMGAYFRRLKARIGPQKACSAAARKLAELFYKMLRYKQIYNDPGEEQYMQRFKEKQLASLQKRAEIIGFNLVPIASVS